MVEQTSYDNGESNRGLVVPNHDGFDIHAINKRGRIHVAVVQKMTSNVYTKALSMNELCALAAFEKQIKLSFTKHPDNILKIKKTDVSVVLSLVTVTRYGYSKKPTKKVVATLVLCRKVLSPEKKKKKSLLKRIVSALRNKEEIH